MRDALVLPAKPPAKPGENRLQNRLQNRVKTGEKPGECSPPYNPHRLTPAFKGGLTLLFAGLRFHFAFFLALVNERIDGKRLPPSVRAGSRRPQIGTVLKYDGRAKSCPQDNENDSQIEFPRKSSWPCHLAVSFPRVRKAASEAVTPLCGLAGLHTASEAATRPSMASLAPIPPAGTQGRQRGCYALCGLAGLYHAIPRRSPGGRAGSGDAIGRTPFGCGMEPGLSRPGARTRISVRHVERRGTLSNFRPLPHARCWRIRDGGKGREAFVRLACAVSPGGCARSSRVRPPPIPQRIAWHRPQPSACVFFVAF